MVAVFTDKKLKSRKPFLGSLLIVAAVLMWPLADAVTKLLYSENALTLIFYVVFFRGVMSYIFGTGLSHEDGQYTPLAQIPQNPDIKISMIRGLSGAMVHIMLLTGLQYLSVVQSTTILFMTPFIVLMLAPFVRGTPFSVISIPIIGIAVLGLFMEMHPTDMPHEQFFYGFGSVLLAALFMAIFTLTTDKYQNYDTYLNMRITGLCYMLLACVGLVFANSMGYTNAYVLDFSTLTHEQSFMLLGAVALNFLGSFFGQEGFKYTPTVLAAVVAYAELFWVIIIEYTLFYTMASREAIIGMVLIALAGIVNAYFNHNKKPKK